MHVTFHSADLTFNLKGKNTFRKWIISEINRTQLLPDKINIIFCSDAYLLEINRKYLNHDYYTDIITFNYNEKNKISGDLFISIERIEENAKKFETSFNSELKRVIIHGILHLLGFYDNSDILKNEMHKREDDALARFPLI